MSNFTGSGSISFDDIFSPISTDDVIVRREKSSKVEFYKPQPPKNGAYTAAIRFIRNPRDKTKSIVEKWVSYMEHPTTGEKKLIDCPSSVGKDSIIKTAWSKLYNSNNEYDKQRAQLVSRRQQFYSIIQIIEDPQHPELNGQLRVFQYGIKLYNKIEKALSTESKYEAKKEVFDLFGGHIFNLKVKIVSGYNNYDDSEFGNVAVPIMVDGKSMQKTEEDFAKIVKFMNENCPDLSKFEFKPWTPEITEYVNDVVRFALGNNNVSKTSYSPPSQPAKQETASSVMQDFDSEIDALRTSPNVPKEIVQQHQQQQKTAPAMDVGEDLDEDILALIRG